MLEKISNNKVLRAKGLLILMRNNGTGLANLQLKLISALNCYKDIQISRSQQLKVMQVNSSTENSEEEDRAMKGRSITMKL